MWPSDQRLEGDMMTYRGKGHTQVKVGLLSNTNIPKEPSSKVMTEWLQDNRERQQHSKTKAKPWHHHPGNCGMAATFVQQKHSKHGTSTAQSLTLQKQLFKTDCIQISVNLKSLKVIKILPRRLHHFWLPSKMN